MNYKLLHFDVHGDARGKLVSLEALKNCPFEIKRMYYIFDTLPNQIRGMHAHKNMEQVIIALDGACTFHLDDGKGNYIEILLNTPEVGLYIGNNIWREMRHFSYGCKLVVLASDYYNEDEYIRDYKKFINEVNQS